MTRYKKDGLEVEIDLERQEATIRYRIDGYDWESSPYQTASMHIEQRDAITAWALIDGWLESES